MGNGRQDYLDTPADVGGHCSSCWRTLQLLDPYKYNVLYIIRNHIHPDLKSEYVMEEEPSTFWAALQTRFEQQKAVILLEANHDWTHLKL
jgi:hypothetical protein